MARETEFEVVEYSGAAGGLGVYLSDFLSQIAPHVAKVTLHSSASDGITLRNSQIVETYAFGNLKGSVSGLSKFFYWFRGLISIVFYRKPLGRIINFHLFDVKVANLLSLLVLRAVSARLLITVHDVSSFRSRDRVVFQSVRFKVLSSICDWFVVHSKTAADELLAVGVGADNIVEFALPPPFNEARVRRANFDVNTDDFEFLLFGNMKLDKGYDVALAAFCKLLKKYPMAKLSIIGFDHEGVLASLNLNLLNELERSRVGVDNRFFPEAELHRRIERADCTIFPYRRLYQSHSVLEAVSRAVPIITSQLPGFEAVLPRKAPSFAPNDSDALAALMRDVMVNYEDWADEACELRRAIHLASDNNASIPKFLRELIV